MAVGRRPGRDHARLGVAEGHFPADEHEVREHGDDAFAAGPGQEADVRHLVRVVNAGKGGVGGEGSGEGGGEGEGRGARGFGRPGAPVSGQARGADGAELERAGGGGARVEVFWGGYGQAPGEDVPGEGILPDPARACNGAEAFRGLWSRFSLGQFDRFGMKRDLGRTRRMARMSSTARKVRRCRTRSSGRAQSGEMQLKTLSVLLPLMLRGGQTWFVLITET